MKLFMKIISVLELKAFRRKTQKIISESTTAMQTPTEHNSCALQELQPNEMYALELAFALM